jgi:hypothetical protein
VRWVLGGIFAIALLVAAPDAQAAQRYAATLGTGIECSIGAPCSLEEAVEKAKTGDEVIVAPGAYVQTTNLDVPDESADVAVHGEFGAPMPQIAGSITGPLIYARAPGTKVSHLSITNSRAGGAGLVCGPGGVIERVSISVAGDGDYGLAVTQSCLARNSIVRAHGERAIAVAGIGYGEPTGFVRNLTGIATGPQSQAIYAQGGGTLTTTYDYTLDVKNTIAGGAGADLVGRAPEPSSGAGKIMISHSNFDSVEPTSGQVFDGGFNQNAPPLFVNAAAGDYHQLPGSSTIDSGTPGPLIGPTDFDGNTRVLGAAPDIGAFEFVPPPVPPIPPSRIQSLKAVPATFRAGNIGEAIVSATKGNGKKAPIGTTVRYTLSAAATVTFTAERRVTGRRVGKKCVKRTKASQQNKKCPLFKKLKGSFTHSGAAGANGFRFSGRLKGKALRPGPYRLVGLAGATRTAPFKIVK